MMGGMASSFRFFYLKRERDKQHERQQERNANQADEGASDAAGAFDLLVGG